MWYIGSRTAEGCNPDDGYLCSSDRVKPMILESKSDWKREVRKMLSQQKLGEKNPSWKGYYVGPDGTKFTSSKEAAKELNVSDVSILRWVKNNKDGWKFIPKTLVATETNVQLNKGENNV
jgi:hypothetical protein